jgi:hypothetical protein
VRSGKALSEKRRMHKQETPSDDDARVEVLPPKTGMGEAMPFSGRTAAGEDTRFEMLPARTRGALRASQVQDGDDSSEHSEVGGSIHESLLEESDVESSRGDQGSPSL